MTQVDKICREGKIGKDSRKLSLYPLEFEEAIESLTKVKPQTKDELGVFTPRS